MTDKKKSSHFGAGMLIGAAIGVAAAAYLRTKEGKAMKKDMAKKVGALQKKVMSQLEARGTFTKERYEELVDKVVAYYVKSKDIAKSEAPQVRRNLLASWNRIKTELKAVK